MNPKVSIIIPCKDIDAQTSECIEDAKIIATGAVSPGRKRNIGAKNSTVGGHAT